MLQVITMALLSLIFLLTSLAGVFPQRPTEIHVKAGEMVALRCCSLRGSSHGKPKPTWTSHTTKEMDLSNSTSSAEQRRMGVVVHGKSLVILSASFNHQGNYSCSLGNASRQCRYSLMVHRTRVEEYEERCNTKESCTLNCPTENVPSVNDAKFSGNAIMWHKEGESSPKDYFSSVEEKDQGVYTCTRSYLYEGQIYNMTFTVVLNVQPINNVKKSSAITSPHMNEIFLVDLGSTVVINCTAVLYSVFEEVFWFSGETRLSNNFTIELETEGRKMTTSMVFQKVSEEDLSKSYTCKLESGSQSSSFVTVTLKKKASSRLSHVSLALTVSGVVVVVMVLTMVLYVKFKMNISLFLRDTLGCRSNTSDAKSFDAFLMCYENDTDAGLSEHDRERMMRVLEERFGYSLCLYDRDVLPGEAAAEAVLDCIEESRAVVLVPTTSDHWAGYGLLIAIHAAHVDRQTRLVFIKTEAAEEKKISGSVPEALQLLAEAGDCVTWRGPRSLSPSSSFWKQLRYYLPAPQHAAKKLLPQTHEESML